MVIAALCLQQVNTGTTQFSVKGEWINELGCIYTIEYYSIKNNKAWEPFFFLLTFLYHFTIILFLEEQKITFEQKKNKLMIQMNLKILMLRQTSPPPPKYILCECIYIKWFTISTDSDSRSVITIAQKWRVKVEGLPRVTSKLLGMMDMLS